MTKTLLLDRSIFSAARVFEQRGTILPAWPKNPLVELVVVKNSRRWAKERGAIIAIVQAASSGKLFLRESPFSFEEGFRVAKWPDLPTSVDIFSCLGIREIEWALPSDPLIKVLNLYTDLTGGSPTERANEYRKRVGLLTKPEFTKGLIQNAPRYGCSESDLQHLKELETVIRKLGGDDRHIVDILQLWTAHTNEIPFFVTLDSTFIRLMTKTITNSWRSRPILPSEICDTLEMSHASFGPLDETESYPVVSGILQKLLEAHVNKLNRR